MKPKFRTSAELTSARKRAAAKEDIHIALPVTPAEVDSIATWLNLEHVAPTAPKTVTAILLKVIARAALVGNLHTGPIARYVETAYHQKHPRSC